jgi:hypothetical protein
MRQKPHRQLAILVFFACFALPAYSAAASSECIRGIPCIVPYTPNDPWEREDGPNYLGPNKIKSEDDACDADFMNQIYARAFLEAERENIKAQVIIRKPDSILEYTCFETQIDRTAEVAGDLFSETDYWREKEIPINGAVGNPVDGMTPVPSVTIDVFMGEEKLKDTLERLVKKGLKDYLGQNFWHDYLGGYATGFDGASCGAMNSIFYFAKCNDMVMDDQFFSFNQLANMDPRQLPRACQGTAIKKDHIKLAENKGGTYAFFDSMEPLNKSEQITYKKFMDPLACNDRKPIPTGVIAVVNHISIDSQGNTKITRTDTFPEKICVTPGCYYDQPSNKCKP